MKWSLGLFLMFLGYALFYTGLVNLRTSGNGPTLSESFGLPHALTAAELDGDILGRTVPGGRGATS